MQKSRGDIEKALSKKGFKMEEKHHRYWYFYVGEIYTGVYTYISTGSGYKDYGDSLLGRMAKELNLNRKQLCDLIDCPMTNERYREILAEKGIL
jgi:hypothetical protein